MSRNSTPTTKKAEDLLLKSSGKKLVQARLPFKIIESSPAAAASDGKSSPAAALPQVQRSENRKRKLSYEDSSDNKNNELDDEVEAANPSDAASKENSNNSTKKSKICAEAAETISLLEDSDDGEKETEKVHTKSVAASSPATPNVKTVVKGKGAGTPKSANTKTNTPSGKPKASSSGGDSATKLHIKLPMKNSNKKNKRKKSIVEHIESKSEELLVSKDDEDSNDSIVIIAEELNPVKRKKLEEKAELPAEISAATKDIIEQPNAIEELSEIEDTTANAKPQKAENDHVPTDATSENARPEESDVIELKTDTESEERKSSSQETVEASAAKKNIAEKANEQVSKIEEQKAADVIELKSDDDSEERKSNSHESNDAAEDVEKLEKNMDGNSTALDSSAIQHVQVDLKSISKKNLTPKQLKLMEQRRLAREEKERKLQEEKEEKQREKEEKELARKREREEREEQRRKEREEKEELRRKEREEKERKRLAEIELKNEEKRKRTEAKEEETRKKDEERKRKELEKEEIEMRKKKESAAFTKFFVPKPTRRISDIEQDQSSKEGTESIAESVLAFRPFQVKGDMKLAPLCRKVFSTEAQANLDAYLSKPSNGPEGKSALYLAELKTGKHLPQKWRRISTDTKDDDVMIVEDDMERAGLAIVQETHQPIERMRAKFYKFHENRRPPYYGTWRKKTQIITARRPIAQDTKYFDYEVDSDDEWEEEEPGESLDGSDDDKEKESDDEDYEVDNEWFVPHGHLSDEELQNQDEYGGGMGDDNNREAQQAKLKMLQQEFAQQMKKKTERIKPRLLGCIWADENGNRPETCPNLIWSTLRLAAIISNEVPLIEEPETCAEKTGEPVSPNSVSGGGGVEKAKPIVLNDEMLKNLVCLVHGNRNSKNFIIKEFIAHMEANEETIKNGDARGPLKSSVRDKIEAFAEWQIIEGEGETKKKKKKKHLCWIVDNETLNKMDLNNLSLENNWQYTLQPRFERKPDDKEKEQKEITAEAATNAAEVKINEKQFSSNTPTTSAEATTTTPSTKKKFNIKQFTKVLTAEEKAKQLKMAISNEPKPSASTTNSPATSTKKRVALLSSVPLGHKGPMPRSSINQFLKNNAKNNETEPMQIEDDVVLID